MFNASSISEFLLTVFGIVIIVGAIVAASAWKDGGIRKVAGIIAMVAGALFLLGIATHTKEAGQWVWNLITGGK